MSERRVRRYPGQGPFQLTDVVHDPFGYELQDLVWHGARGKGRVAPQDCQPGFDVGRLDIGGKTPVEAAPQAVLESYQAPGRPVAAEHQLLAVLVQGVECMEELLEQLLLTFQKLDIVQEQDVQTPVARLELIHPLAADAVDEVVEEGFGGRVADREPRVEFQDVPSDGLQQVGLAEAGAGVDEERVVLAARLLGDGECGRVREAVGVGVDVAVAVVVGVAVRVDGDDRLGVAVPLGDLRPDEAGGGIVGHNSAKIALGMVARVTIIDKNLNRLRELDDIFRSVIDENGLASF